MTLSAETITDLEIDLERAAHQGHWGTGLTAALQLAQGLDDQAKRDQYTALAQVYATMIQTDRSREQNLIQADLLDKVQNIRYRQEQMANAVSAIASRQPTGSY